MNHAIEKTSIFPYIAWTLIVLFALLTYGFIRSLHTELADVKKDVDSLEAQVQMQQ